MHILFQQNQVIRVVTKNFHLFMISLCVIAYSNELLTVENTPVLPQIQRIEKLKSIWKRTKKSKNPSIVIVKIKLTLIRYREWITLC